MPVMYIGEEFDSYDEFKARVTSLCESQTYSLQCSRDNASTTQGQRARFVCDHTGSTRVHVITSRELRHKQRTVTSPCQAEIAMMTDRESGKCVVLTAHLNHDHDICQEIFFQYPSIRRLHKSIDRYGLTQGELEEVLECLDTNKLKHPHLSRLHRLLKMTSRDNKRVAR